MKTYFLYISLLFLLTIDIQSELFFKDSIDARSNIQLISPYTRSNATYIVKVWGEYSQWNLSDPKGIGNDAVWYNDIPKYGNPIVDNIVKSIFTEPLWYGDSTIYEIPIVNQKFSMIDYVGFRFNGKPLPEMEQDTLNHTYQIELNGSGESLTFEIWDYVLNTNNNSREPRYEDNEGMLYIEVYEYINKIPKNCGDYIFNYNNSNQIILRVEINQEDSLSLFIDGEEIEDFSVDCGDTFNIRTSNTLIIDNTGSMNNPLNYIISKSKLNYLEEALDSINTMKFQSNIIYLNQNEENNDFSVEGNTFLFKRIYESIKELPDNENILIFTDGYSPEDKIYIDSLHFLIEKRPSLKLFFLLFLNQNIKVDQNKYLDFVSISNYVGSSKLFTINTQSDLYSRLNEMSRLNFNDECCYISFFIDNCYSNNHFIELINGTIKYDYNIDCANINNQYKHTQIKKLLINRDELNQYKDEYVVYSIYGVYTGENFQNLPNGIYLLKNKHSSDHLIIKVVE